MSVSRASGIAPLTSGGAKEYHEYLYRNIIIMNTINYIAMEEISPMEELSIYDGN